MWIILVGAFLVICGMLHMIREAIGRRRMSGRSRASRSRTHLTLEPWRQGLGFLRLSRNWPGLALMAVGAAFLLFGAAI